MGNSTSTPAQTCATNCSNQGMTEYKSSSKLDNFNVNNVSALGKRWPYVPFVDSSANCVCKDPKDGKLYLP